MDIKTQKQLQLDQLYAPYKNCLRCPLGSLGRTKVVFGEGNPDADLMIVGEGPGKDEDEQGRPFIGRSGKLLTKALTQLGIKRENIFITNVVKCRPPENRAPTKKESGICTSLLLNAQIKIIAPKVVCTLGASALSSFLQQITTMAQARGKEIPIGGAILMPTYHPAYILRNQKKLCLLVDDLKKAYLHSKK